MISSPFILPFAVLLLPSSFSVVFCLRLRPASSDYFCGRLSRGLMIISSCLSHLTVPLVQKCTRAFSWSGCLLLCRTNKKNSRGKVFFPLSFLSCQSVCPTSLHVLESFISLEVYPACYGLEARFQKHPGSLWSKGFLHSRCPYALYDPHCNSRDCFMGPVKCQTSYSSYGMNSY